MAKKDGEGGADGVEDLSLLDEDATLDDLGGGQDAGTQDGAQDAGAKDGDKEDKKDEGAKAEDDDIQVVIEEETEAQARSKDQEADGALDQGRTTDDPDGDEQYSQNVRRRIAREQEIARRERARADGANARARQAEMRGLSREKVALETTSAAIKLQIDTTKKMLVKAKEDGKSEAEVDLQAQLNKLQQQETNIEHAQHQLKTDEEKLRAGGADAGPNPLAERWKERNRWFSDPRYREQASIARVIDGEMATKGYDKQSQDYFDELDRRIRRRLPEMAKILPAARAGTGGAKPRDETRREATGGVPRGGGAADQGAGQARRPNKVVLNKADFATMRTMGLDTKDPAVLKQYAKEKMATDSKGGR